MSRINWFIDIFDIFSWFYTFFLCIIFYIGYIIFLKVEQFNFNWITWFKIYNKSHIIVFIIYIIKFKDKNKCQTNLYYSLKFNTKDFLLKTRMLIIILARPQILTSPLQPNKFKRTHMANYLHHNLSPNHPKTDNKSSLFYLNNKINNLSKIRLLNNKRLWELDSKRIWLIKIKLFECLKNHFRLIIKEIRLKRKKKII